MSERALGTGLAAFAAGAAGLAGSILLLALGQPWVRIFFYLPAWWSFLLLAAGLNRVRGRPSVLLDDARLLLRMALFSVPAWLLYEAINLRICNWEYWDLPDILVLRWAGYALAFATVLPAIFEMAEALRWGPVDQSGPGDPSGKRNITTRHAWQVVMLHSAGVGEDGRKGPLPEAFERSCLALGLLFFALPLVWPRYCFPLVWGFAFLLLEPRLARAHPESSWLAAFRAGRRGEVRALLASGLACGLLWEALNYWAGGKWRYTVPWPTGPKLFEMPLAGYLGFPPFALGCATLWRTFDLAWRSSGPGLRAAAAAVLLALSLLVFFAMDLRTVRGLVPLPL